MKKIDFQSLSIADQKSGLDMFSLKVAELILGHYLNKDCFFHLAYVLKKSIACLY